MASLQDVLYGIRRQPDAVVEARIVSFLTGDGGAWISTDPCCVLAAAVAAHVRGETPTYEQIELARDALAEVT